MDLYEVADQIVALLKERGRVSYRSLKRQFALDDDYVEDLKEELRFSHPEIADEEGRGLVWIGHGSPEARAQRLESTTANLPDPRPPTLDPRPVSYTPPHLAERIRATVITDGERKTITALFVDLKGSTALIEGLDPEEARAIIDPALQLMMDAVHRYEGYVAQALGDGIFALFGAPLAHEDHPQRALYAALRMQEEMRRYADTLRAKGYPPLLMRVGVNTGEVVLRSIRKDDLHADYVPVGHSTNLAARMEQLANPGTIVVSAHTHRLTDGYFAFKNLGPTQIKGGEEPLNIYEVLGVGALRTRLQVSARRGLTRFVGRQSEMEQLRKALEHAKAGQGQIVGTMGEPGLGKSRLFYEFKLLSVSGCLVLDAYSVSHGKATAYLPVIELLKSYFDIKGEDDERKRREKVAGKVVILDRTLEEILPYLYALLGIEEQPSPLQQMDPQIRRRRTFEALKKLFLRESLNQPLILIFEDLHWIDGETQGFLDVLSESVASAKLLLLTNYRPEYRHEWGQKTYYTQLRLSPFGKAEAEEFLDELLGEKGSPLPRWERDKERVIDSPLQQLKQLILDKTEGTPFFMEEIVQELVEQGVLRQDSSVGWVTTHPTTTLQLPTTVQGVLAARIDRLAPEEKTLLQQLAVIGREFPVNLIRQVISQPEDELYSLLASLQRKEFLYEQPAFPDVEYIFKHALTQEVAYGTVLQEQRKLLHERTGQALETVCAATLSEHYSDLAHHFSRSGNTEKAVQYLGLAGRQAVQRSAYTEAISHLRLAVELLQILPDTVERAQEELTLRIALGFSLISTAGYGTPEVGQTFLRARELCQQIGEPPQLFSVLRGLWNFYLLRAEYQAVHEIAEQFLSLAQRRQDPIFLLAAHEQMGFFLLWLAELITSREHHEQAISCYDPQQHSTYVSLYEADLGMWSVAQVALVLWYLGYPEQALQKSREALRLAHELKHPFSTSWVLATAAWLHQLRQEPQETQRLVETLIAFSQDQGFQAWLGVETTLHGWALAMQGQGQEGIAQIRQGIVIWQGMGAEGIRSFFLALLAEAYGKQGQTEDGLTVLNEALERVNQTGERFNEGELYRIKGELLLTQESKEQGARSEEQGAGSREQEAESCFLKAIETAQKQQAKSLDLRATMSLARLWQRQASEQSAKGQEQRVGNTEQGSRTRLAEAHRMLSEIYGWFTEGFDTKDLQEAKTLLEELT